MKVYLSIPSDCSLVCILLMQESGSGGDSIRGIIDPVAAELAGGSVFSVLGVIRNPLIAVLLVWLLSSKIAALPIFDVVRCFYIIGSYYERNNVLYPVRMTSLLGGHHWLLMLRAVETLGALSRLW